MSASVGKAADILRAFRPTVEVLSVRGLAERTGLPRSTVHHLCRTLCETGLLEAVPHAGYRLGPLLLELGGLIIERTGLVAAVEGSTAALRRGPGQELHVGQLVDGWIVYLHRESGPDRVAMVNRVGMRAPAFRSGCGRSALAVLDPVEADQRIRRLCRDEDLPLPDMASIDEELAVIRSQGYCVCRTFQPGRTSVAAAVVGADRQPVGALSLAGPSSTFAPSRLTDIGSAVTEAAHVASTRLQIAGGAPGGRPPATAGRAAVPTRHLAGTAPPSPRRASEIASRIRSGVAGR